MRLILCLLLLTLSPTIFGQEERVWMHPNRGQWHKNILQKVEVIGGEMYVENHGLTFFMHNASEVYHGSHGHSDHEGHDHTFKGQVIRAHYVGSNSSAKKTEAEFSTHYRNYFLGRDSSTWKSDVYSIASYSMHDFYPGIDYILKGKTNQLEYLFALKPNANPALIQRKIDGASRVTIDKSGNLHIVHRFGEIIESAPKAWTEDASGNKTNVKIQFKLINNTLSFDFPNGYDQSQTLWIDPELTFSSFSGATVDNWGFTAAPDLAGNVFGAGIVFGAGYPFVTGSFDGTYNGSGPNPGFDLGITKFNASGTALLYSTYIGGSGSETPNSIVCNAANELFIMGVTSSSNFPVTANAHNTQFLGGPTIEQNGLTFNGGTDLFVARLSAGGNALLGATIIGGSNTDGLNTGALQYNYGDQFRGEIILDNAGNPIISSTTRSTNFPTVNGFQLFLNGMQDAVVFKYNANLTNLLWSSYFGGVGLESGNSVQQSSTGELYMTGGTSSTNLSLGSGHTLAYQGSISDGYVIRLSSGNPTILSGTYIGTGAYDQAYFVQLDLDNNVYVFGQTAGNMPITAGLYGTANSGQFIRKYNTNLTTLLWNTTVGSGSGNVQISPTAFLVSDCYDIYFSGWGGVLNANASVSQAINSTTFGFQTTQDAFQSNTNGSNFYIAVLSENAATLKYATYMGGVNSSNNHVDGGTSRFDKSGRIYHAVCGACGGNDFGFTTTPSAFSPSNPSPNCNMAVFKFELNQIDALVSQPAPLICLPNPVVFNNNSANGNTFQWSFGDGNTSTQVNPSHVYAGPGQYTVTLVVSDSQGCFSPDTTSFEVNIGSFNGAVVQPTNPICPGETYQLDASGGAVYSWTPAQFLNNPNISNPVATVTETTTFTVVISDSCGSDTLTVTLPVSEGNATVANDTSICIGNSAPLFATGGGTYLWSPAGSLDNPTSATPTATPTETTTYTVEITAPSGCTFTEEVVVQVFFTPPVPVIPDLVNLCFGESATITVSGADSYFWSPPTAISPTTGSTVVVNPTVNSWYFCDFTNACGTLRDSVFVELIIPNITAGFDTIICPGQTAILQAFGGVSYAWSPINSLSAPTGSSVFATPTQPTTYTVIGTDQFGCTGTATVQVDLFPKAFIQTVPNVYAFLGDIVQLGATSTTSGQYIWSPSEFLSCVACTSPFANPDQNYVYTVTYTDANGCSASDQVTIFYDPIIYVPNTFTPNGNLFNEEFRAFGGNIKTFEMLIFNRWGELIKTIHSLNDTWDGTFKDLPCPDGTYVWKMSYTDFTDKEYERVGHINLLR